MKRNKNHEKTRYVIITLNQFSSSVHFLKSFYGVSVSFELYYYYYLSILSHIFGIITNDRKWFYHETVWFVCCINLSIEFILSN